MRRRVTSSMSASSKVAIGMSGGVDSSVAAALLIEQGHEVVGITMLLGLADLHGRAGCGEDEAALAERVCAELGIPHSVVDVAAEFEQAVVEPFVSAYACGQTPNPCVWCNERVKFRLLLAHARALGCEKLATGHYARIVQDAGGDPRLARGTDTAKDQSYFLYRLSQDTLRDVIFPLGEMTKEQVRTQARRLALPVAERTESQEICFSEDHHELISGRHPEALVPGDIVNADGVVLGRHKGIARYTIGQRKGLGIGGPGGPYRVLRIDVENNRLVVGGNEGPSTAQMTLVDPVWYAPDPGLSVRAQLRYRSAPLDAEALYDGKTIALLFARDVSTTAPGQSVVLYVDDTVVGGGILGGDA